MSEFTKEQRFPLGSRRIGKDGEPEVYIKWVASNSEETIKEIIE